jgi:hypothetical protein
MSPQISVDNELRILRNQEVKQVVEIMIMFIGFLVLPYIFPNVEETNQDLEMDFCRSPISVVHVQGFYGKMDLCLGHNPCLEIWKFYKSSQN